MDTTKTTRAARAAPPPPGEDPCGRAAGSARSRRQRIRSNPGLFLGYRIGVFLAGLLCIAVGVALAVLPGPLTIPPVLLGLWIWSTEFRFARRFFESFQRKGREAWEHAKRHPRSSAAVTAGGLLAAAVVMWAAVHFELVGQARQSVGI